MSHVCLGEGCASCTRVTMACHITSCAILSTPRSDQQAHGGTWTRCEHISSKGSSSQHPPISQIGRCTQLHRLASARYHTPQKHNRSGIRRTHYDTNHKRLLQQSSKQDWGYEGGGVISTASIFVPKQIDARTMQSCNRTVCIVCTIARNTILEPDRDTCQWIVSAR